MNADIVTAALLLVHEATHARYTNEGKEADVRALTRDVYVARMLGEEAEAETNVIEARDELGSRNIDVSGATVLFANHYLDAYEEAVDSAIIPGVSAEEPHRVERAAGKSRIIEGFTRGFVVASTTGATYPVAYGKNWDGVNGLEATLSLTASPTTSTTSTPA